MSARSTRSTASVVVLVLGLLLVAAYVVLGRSTGHTDGPDGPDPRSPGASQGSDRASATVARSELPAEARRTITLVERGGPFPYDRDGVTFGNYERLLPQRPRGYYREYTVRTPGSSDRGPRRLVVGGDRTFYYTADHYASFRRVVDR